jgi:hypothetical protein
VNLNGQWRFRFLPGAYFAVPAGAITMYDRHHSDVSAIVRNKTHMAALMVMFSDEASDWPVSTFGDQRPAQVSADAPARASRSAEEDKSLGAGWAWLFVSVIIATLLLATVYTTARIEDKARISVLPSQHGELSHARAPCQRNTDLVVDSRQWLDYQPGAGDIVVATYPKCGTTGCSGSSVADFQSAEPRPVSVIAGMTCGLPPPG